MQDATSETPSQQPIDGSFQILYFNDFRNEINQIDARMLLAINGQPALMLNATHAVAKAFATTLLELVKKFEEKTGTTIPDLPIKP